MKNDLILRIQNLCKAIYNKRLGERGGVGQKWVVLTAHTGYHIQDSSKSGLFGTEQKINCEIESIVQDCNVQSRKKQTLCQTKYDILKI